MLVHTVEIIVLSRETRNMLSRTEATRRTLVALSSSTNCSPSTFGVSRLEPSDASRAGPESNDSSGFESGLLGMGVEGRAVMATGRCALPFYGVCVRLVDFGCLVYQ